MFRPQSTLTPAEVASLFAHRAALTKRCVLYLVRSAYPAYIALVHLGRVPVLPSTLPTSHLHSIFSNTINHSHESTKRPWQRRRRRKRSSRCRSRRVSLTRRRTRRVPISWRIPISWRQRRSWRFSLSWRTPLAWWARRVWGRCPTHLQRRRTCADRSQHQCIPGTYHAHPRCTGRT